MVGMADSKSGLESDCWTQILLWENNFRF